MLPGMKRLAAIFAVASMALLSAACERGKDDADQPAKAAEGDTTAEAVPAGIEDRVARLERKLKKVEGFLKEATGGQYGRLVPDPEATYGVPVSQLDPVIGPPDAAVTLVEAYTYT
jgi:hypothetical protein